jgi:hypothetical protein
MHIPRQHHALDEEVYADGLLILPGEVILAEAHGDAGLADSTCM